MHAMRQVGTAALVALLVPLSAVAGCSSKDSTCTQAQADASAYLQDAAVASQNTSLFKANAAAGPSLDPKNLTGFEVELQRLGVGQGLPVGQWNTDWEDAYNHYLERGEKPVARPSDQDFQLFYAVVDQYPKCFNPDVRAQVKVAETQ